MVVGLILLRSIVPEIDSLLSLSSGCLVGGSLYLASCFLESSGRAQIRALVRDVTTSLQRSPAGEGTRLRVRRSVL